MMKKICSAVIGLCLVYLTGCLDAEKTRIYFDVQPDLSGTASIEFIGIQSREKSSEAQKKEMAQFFEAGYVEQGTQIANEWSIQNAKPSLSNKTELKCDGKLIGEFSDLTKSLFPLIDQRDAEYEIKRDQNRFSFAARGIADHEHNDIIFSLHYAGKILENNAHHYDAAKHLMEWNFQKLDNSGIHFVLEAKK